MLFPSLFPFLLTSGEADTTTYDLIQAFGESYLDEWKFDNIVIEDSVLLQHGETTRPEFGINTIMLMPFENNLDAGNFPTNDKPVTHWRLLRRVFGTTQFYELGIIVNDNTNIFYDTSVKANEKVEYAIQSVSNGTRGNAVVTEAIGEQGEPLEAIEVSYFGWKLSSIDYNPDIPIGTVYSFVVGNETEDIRNVIARTSYESAYSKFVKVERGVSEYHEGSMTTMPFDCQSGLFVFGNYNSRKALEAFLNDGEPKILKNGSGDVYVVDVFDVSIKLDDILCNPDYTQPYTVSFSWIEIEEGV